MFATKGRLKVSLLVVGVLVVGLGMYGAFQLQEVEANNSSWSCVIMVDRIYLSTSVLLGSSYTGKTRTRETNCFNCRRAPRTYKHTQKEKVSSHSYAHHWEHRWPWSSSWSYCHIHTGISSRVDWKTVRCNRRVVLQSGTKENYLTGRRRFI